MRMLLKKRPYKNNNYLREPAREPVVSYEWQNLYKGIRWFSRSLFHLLHLLPLCQPPTEPLGFPEAVRFGQGLHEG